MKLFTTTLSVLSSILLFSCNNGSSTNEAEIKDTTTTAPVETKVEKPAFQPFKVVVIQHKVNNFQKAHDGYFKRDSLLRAYGLTHFSMGRLQKDSNTIFIIDKVEDVDKSRAFFKDEKVKATMKKAGVHSDPGYTYAEIIRYNEPASSSPYRLAVTHHVKDFSAWLQAFDSKAADRTANGMNEMAVARNFDDSNTVSVLFAITDTAKAKARMASPEVKKIMADAGVDTPPAIRWYKEVE
ncbi:MAG: hypothetical protein J7497_00530 [Chitinophagaceae bacterium]|nr:hypothetical protein [Chitinophagaceae bacterium]